MSSISLPDAKLGLPNLTLDNKPLFRLAWNYRKGEGENRILYLGTAHYEPRDVRQIFNKVDGVGFMKTMVTFVEQRRIYNKGGPHYGWSYATEDGKHMYIKFMWDGDELVTDNENIDKSVGLTPYFDINQHFAQQMGWFKVREDGTHDLGPNLRQEFFSDTVPDVTTENEQLLDDDERAAFWGKYDGFYKLSFLCNWRFLNLNEAFQNIVGHNSRSLLVYSSVGSSSMVGNQVTDLLREVNYRRRGEGSVYFGPLHVQYIPLRNQVIDIIETAVSESTTEGNGFLSDIVKESLGGAVKGFKSGRGIGDRIRRAGQGAKSGPKRAVKRKLKEVIDRNVKRKLNDIFGEE
ncbi:hypothetical protein ACROYT_G026250 [Oculina patagonica]